MFESSQNRKLWLNLTPLDDMIALSGEFQDPHMKKTSTCDRRRVARCGCIHKAHVNWTQKSIYAKTFTFVLEEDTNVRFTQIQSKHLILSHFTHERWLMWFLLLHSELSLHWREMFAFTGNASKWKRKIEGRIVVNRKKMRASSRDCHAESCSTEKPAEILCGSLSVLSLSSWHRPTLCGWQPIPGCIAVTGFHAPRAYFQIQITSVKSFTF